MANSIYFETSNLNGTVVKENNKNAISNNDSESVIITPRMPFRTSSPCGHSPVRCDLLA